MEADVLGAAMMTPVLLAMLAAAPVEWGEGRQAFADVSTVAEVEPSAAGAAALRELDPTAFVREGSQRVSLWQLSAADSSRVLAALEAKLPGHFAPVFHDAPNPASKLRVPAGGVLVWLDGVVTAEQWAAQRGLVVKQTFGKETVLVESAPGEATLALVARLRSDRKVKVVMANWWLRAVRR